MKHATCYMLHASHFRWACFVFVFVLRVIVLSVHSFHCAFESVFEFPILCSAVSKALTLRFSSFTDAAQHLSVTVIPMEMPLSAAVAILGHARAAMEARPIGKTRRAMVFYFAHFTVCFV